MDNRTRRYALLASLVHLGPSPRPHLPTVLCACLLAACGAGEEPPHQDPTPAHQGRPPPPDMPLHRDERSLQLDAIAALQAYLAAPTDSATLASARKDLEATARRSLSHRAEVSTSLLLDIAQRLAEEPSDLPIERQLILDFLLPTPTQTEHLPPLFATIQKDLDPDAPLSAALKLQAGRPIYTQLAGDHFHYARPQSPYAKVLPHLQAQTGLTFEEGAHIADIASGVGSLSFELARQLGPDSRVWAVDIDPQVIAFIRQACERLPEGPQVQAVHSTRDDVMLAEATLDGAVIIGNGFMGFQEGSRPPPETGRFLRSVLQALKPGAPLAIYAFEHAQALDSNARAAGFEHQALVPSKKTLFSRPGADVAWLVLRRPAQR